MKPQGVSRLVLFLIAASCIGCDQVTKRVAIEELAGEAPMSFLGDTLRIQYAENRGAFLGWGSDWSDTTRLWVFGIGTAIVLAIIGWRLARGTFTERGTQIAFTLLLGGGIANLIDRIARGSVVDFLNLGIGPVRTGIFNVADVAISAGAVYLLIRGFREDREAEARAANS